MSLKSSILFFVLAMALYGQAAPPENDQADPEDRNHGVARVSLMNGDVSVRRGDSGDFVAGNVNAPVMSGDGVQTGVASRAEVQFDFANRLRLGALTEARMGDLRSGFVQVQVARGTATFTEIGDTQAQIEISTPNSALRPSRRGAYRISVHEDGTTEFTVRAGEADIYTQQGSQHLSAGQTMLLRGAANDPEYQIVASPSRDEWDQFNETRDRELAASTAYQHVSKDVPGAEDLDQYGRWNNDPTYGNVWVPNVAADWAPYQSGRWVWEDYYGWTWVSYDPWGWAPYHYGRWYRGPVGWAWVPGPIYGRYGYRPALVGFFGFGGGVGFGVGFGFGNLGWVALAPFEAFHPWYGRGFGARGFGVINNVNIYNTFRNARVTNGVMSMSSQQFQNGQFGHYSHPGAVQLQSGGAVRGQLPITPRNNNLRFNDRQTSAAAARGVTGQQKFVSRGGFAPVQRQSFTQQRQSLQQNLSSPRGGAEAGRGMPQGSAASGGGASSWQRFGTPASSASRNASSGAFQSTSGWGRFGSPAASGQTSPAGNSNYGRTGTAAPYSSQTTRTAPAGSSYTSGRPVQIAPSIVQQRSGGTSNSGGAPSSSRQSTPAPVTSRPAGSHESGGHSSGSSSGRSSSSGGHGR